MSESHVRAAARRNGASAVRTVRCRVHGGYLTRNSESVSDEVFTGRLRLFSDIVASATKDRFYEIWAAQAVTDIAEAGGHAHAAAKEVYGKRPWPPDGMHASDRVRRMSDEAVGRLSRSCSRQIKLIEAVLPAFLPAATWKSLSQPDRARLPLPWPADMSAIDYTERRNTLRAIRNAERSLGHLPDDPYDIVSCPTISADNFVCPLDASDDQGVRLDGDVLSVQLPLCENPGKADWAWHSLKLGLPAFAKERYAAGTPCRPAIRVDGDDLYLLVPLDVPTPEKRTTGRTFAVDWGIRKLATGSVTYLVDGEVFTTGRPYHFIGAGFQHKQHDRKDQAQVLGGKIRQDEALLRGKREPDPGLSARLGFLRRERDLAWRAFHRANDQYARAGARWNVACALAEGCDTIAFEDLASLQTRDHGHQQNSRDNLQVRGKLVKYTMELAQMAGLNVVTVEPRGTSSRCSRCGRPSAFRHAPDRRGGHDNCIACACGRSSDRDHSGSEAIGARSFDASPAKRGRKRKPTPGPASYHKIRVRREPRRACQRTPFPAYRHTASLVSITIHTQPSPSMEDRAPPTTASAITSRLPIGPHPSRPRDETAPSRVDRGPGVARQPGRPDDLRPRYPISRTGPPRALVLDGLCAGFWHRVRMSRPRACAAPPAGSGNAG